MLNKRKMRPIQTSGNSQNDVIQASVRRDWCCWDGAWNFTVDCFSLRCYPPTRMLWMAHHADLNDADGNIRRGNMAVFIVDVNAMHGCTTDSRTNGCETDSRKIWWLLNHGRLSIRVLRVSVTGDTSLSWEHQTSQSGIYKRIVTIATCCARAEQKLFHLSSSILRPEAQYRPTDGRAVENKFKTIAKLNPSKPGKHGHRRGGGPTAGVQRSEEQPVEFVARDNEP